MFHQVFFNFKDNLEALGVNQWLNALIQLQKYWSKLDEFFFLCLETTPNWICSLSKGHFIMAYCTSFLTCAHFASKIVCPPLFFLFPHVFPKNPTLELIDFLLVHLCAHNASNCKHNVIIVENDQIAHGWPWVHPKFLVHQPWSCLWMEKIRGRNTLQNFNTTMNVPFYNSFILRVIKIYTSEGSRKKTFVRKCFRLKIWWNH